MKWIITCATIALTSMVSACRDGSAVTDVDLGGTEAEGELGEPQTELARPQDSREFFIPEEQRVFDALGEAEAFYGIHPGIHGAASYRIEVPDDWNGVLVMWAHGYRGNGPDLRVTNPGWIRGYLIENGYAWAASSYSTNYLDSRAGVEDTNALALAFETLTGRAAPTKYYIAGGSMGGQVTGAAIEEETLATAANRVRYAGAMPLCGVMGDIALRNYFFAYNAAAYQLAGLAVQAFPFPDHLERAIEIQEELWVNFDEDPGEPTEQGDKLRNALRHLSGGARPAFEEGFGPWQNTLFGRGAGDGTLDGIFGQIAVNTSGFVYQLDDDPALSAEEVAFNVDVFRVDGDFLANNPVRSDGVRAMPILAGRFDVPVVTLHTLGDLFVPFSMEQIYAERAQANGSGSWLVQRAIRGTGHCGFDTDEVTAAFQAMVNWSETGTVPEGDDVLNPTVVALPSYGCRFTTVTRTPIPACP